MNNALTIALSKGRIFQETLPLLAAAGIEPVDDPETSRKLILDTNQHDVKLVIIRASDVPTYDARLLESKEPWAEAAAR